MAIDRDMVNQTNDTGDIQHPVKLLLTVEEAAQALSLSRTLTYALLMRRELASIKVGRVRRIPIAALRDFVTQRLAEAVSAG
jgi:excisionase family DNA binding protein